MTALKIRNRNEISLDDGSPSSTRYSDHLASSLHYSNMVESVITLRNMTKDGTALIVPVYNDIELLQDFLDAIKEQTTVPDIIVVDNGSSHDLSRTLANRNEVAVIVRLKNNYGSSGGYYSGMYFAMKNNYKFIILSDVDAIPVSPDLIEREIEILQKGYDFVSAINIVPHTIIANAHRLGCSYVLPVKMGYDSIRPDSYFFVGSTVAAQYTAIKAEILQKVGLYDPCFYFSYDDIDLSMRLRKYGTSALIRNAMYLHYFTSQRIKALSIVGLIRNSFLFNLRWHSRLAGIFGVLRSNLVLWLDSTICNSSFLPSVIMGLRIFLNNVMGGVKGIPRGDMFLYSGQFTTMSLAPVIGCEQHITSCFNSRIIVRANQQIKLIQGTTLLFTRVRYVCLSLWEQFALANLNPWIKVIRRIDFDPNRKQIMQFEFHSVPRRKASSWLRLIVNAPFFLSLVPVLILGAMLFKDHDKGVHD